MGQEQYETDQINDLKQKVERHEDAARTFCEITNDLNNLIAAMKGQAQLAAEDPSGQEMAELVEVVLTGTAKAQNVIQLGLSRLASVPDYETIVPIELVQSSGTSTNIRILVVDDEESMRKVISRIMRKNGYDVVTASSGQEAIKICRGSSFDIAFVDLRLGDMSGTDVFRELRIHCPRTHVIFVSGDPGLEQVKDAKASDGMAAFVKKPFEVKEINELVSYILTIRSALAV